MTIILTGKQLIANNESGEGESTFTAMNPRTKQKNKTQFHNATKAEIDQAANAAAIAYSETRNYSAERLAAFLDRVAAEIEALGDELLNVTDAETGLGLPRLTGERGRTTGQLRQFGALLREGSYVEAIIDTAQPQRQPAPRPSIRRMLFPLGPVAVFSASNFPFAFAVAGGDTASAFAAGCPVVIKGHPSHPATSELFARAINRAITALDFPPGFFSLLQGETIAVGQTLVTHPQITAVGFTGSLRAGRAIYDAAAARPIPIPVYAEMGSINPVVILPDAIQTNLKSVTAGLVNSITMGSGQFCTNPGLIFMLDGATTQTFITEVSNSMAQQQPGVLLNANIEAGLDQAVSNTMQKPEVISLTGGAVVSGDSYCYNNTVLQTTAVAFRNDPDLQTEHFGPVTLFVLAESVDELLQTLDSLHGNLTATVFCDATEQDVAPQVLDRLREKVGRLILNGFPTGVEVVYAMQHGGPYPATTTAATTSVGKTAIKRFMRPVALQNMPDSLLPPALQDANPLGIWRIIDDNWTQDQIG